MLKRITYLSRQISRRKVFAQKEDGDVLDSYAGLGPKLSRILNLFDLTFLGIGSTLGVGIYVLAGSVAQNVAGPAVCLSFLVAAIASGISGIVKHVFKIVNLKFIKLTCLLKLLKLFVMLNLEPEYRKLVLRIHIAILLLVNWSPL